MGIEIVTGTSWASLNSILVECVFEKTLHRAIYVYTSIADMKKTTLPTLPCFCASLRRASRALTQLYERALRPHGLRATQFTVLQVLERAGEISQGQLGQVLAMDSTTLTRTLKIMLRQGWISERRGEDRRERWLRLARGGAHLLQRATPAWEKTQAGVRHRLGSPQWEQLRQMSDDVTNLISN
jgi:DNA-binding MarR family transcriptional regulator